MAYMAFTSTGPVQGRGPGKREQGLTLTEVAALVTGADTKENSWLIAPPGVACARHDFPTRMHSDTFLPASSHCFTLDATWHAASSGACPGVHDATSFLSHHGSQPVVLH